MKIYYGGDKNQGGFRFLSNGFICIDLIDENVPLDSYLKNICSFIRSNYIDKIFINSASGKTLDLSFLNELENVDELQISAICDDLEPVYRLSPTKLHLQTQNYPIEFSRLQDDLIELTLYNIIAQKSEFCLNEGILNCKKLKKISICDYRTKDLELISRLSWLEELSLVDCADKRIKIPNFSQLKNIKVLLLQKGSEKTFEIVDKFHSLTVLWCNQMTIRSFNAIKATECLKELHVNYCSKLTDISALEKCQSLQIVGFESCKNIQDLTPLTALKNLKQLVLFKCGEIPSLGFINEIPSLESILFTETNILDGDLRPCLRLKSAWSSTGKRHYNINVEDLPHN